MIIREVLLHYGFPERMDGMDVLDVGRGSGFFAFSSSGGALQSLRRTFAPSSIWTSWVAMSSGMRDARPLETSKGLPSSTSPGAFAFAGGARKSRVTSKLINLYEMSPSGVRQPKLRSCFCGIHYFAPPRPRSLHSKGCVGDERRVPNRGAALRFQAGSYRRPIHLHLAKPVRPISEGTASGSARGRAGRLARWHGLCERPIRFIGQI